MRGRTSVASVRSIAVVSLTAPVATSSVDTLFPPTTKRFAPSGEKFAAVAACGTPAEPTMVA
ncbi:hypothetical protein [Microbacterium sp. SORGH_AS_0862]|uniref:hypothetical protein n=1 Tax=Microbacterium sp. SORGH_AS_0862 TaxID=3041789 RepID=UPI00359343F5